MKRLFQIFQSKYATAFCIVFAIANRIVFTTLYSTIGRDTKLQLIYAENFLAGNGMGRFKYFSTNLSEPVFDTHWFFPPGFSFSIIPFLKLFNGDEYKAVLAFDILAAVLFVLAVRLLGRKAGLQRSTNNLVTLIAGCSQYPFFMSSSSTDVISVTLVLFAMIAMIEIVNSKKKLSFFQICGYGFLFFLPSFFRFMYLPITLFLPIFILLAGFWIKSKELKLSGIKLFFASTILLLVLFGLTVFYSGNAVHVKDTGRGIFFDQIIRWYPFLPASFMNLDFAAQQVDRISSIGYSNVIFYLEIINAIFFLFLVALLIRYLARYKRISSLPRHSLFIICGGLISIVILAMLAYLSLTYKPQNLGEYKWIYSYEVRYFAFIYVFIPLLFIISTQFYPNHFKSNLARLFALIAISCLLIEVLHGFYYNTKIVLANKSINIIRDRDKDYRSFPGIIEELKNKNPGKEIIVSAPDQFYLNTAMQLGYKGIFDYTNLNKTELKLKSPAILLIPVHTQDAQLLKEYVEKKHPQIISTISGTTFYIEELGTQ